MLLVIGDSNADAIARVPRFPREGDDLPLDGLSWSSGGAGVNVATGFARLGGAARLVSRVGCDPAAGAALAAAERSGVDLAAVQREPDRATGLCVVIVSASGERTFLSHRGANAALRTPPAAVLDGVRRVHVCGHALLGGEQRAAALAVVEEAAARGHAVSLDLCLPLVERAPAAAEELFPALDVLFANDAEMCLLASGARAENPTSPEVERAARRARERGARAVVVKRGAAGALVVTDGAAEIAPPFAVDAVDSTAAGDAFVAAFLWAAEHGLGPLPAARLANAAGALTAARAGSADVLPSRDEVARFLDARGARGDFAVPWGASP